ncbi:MAG: AMIN domain-containing protein, partial [Acidobacteria bacterium]|nr:AMIN domain-containing protein [Acidobacteriota bacterium]
MRINAVFIAALLFLSSSLASSSPAQNSTLLQKARAAFDGAQKLESELNEKPDGERTRNAYVKVIKAFERVYLITPRTGYADNALMTIARLYEEIHERPTAVKTLKFLLREYPGTPFKDTAEKDLARLQGVALQKTAAVDNVRYWEAQNSVRVVVDLAGETTFTQGEAKNPDRVFIDIAPARLNSMLVGKQWPVQSGLLQQIRVGQYETSTVRVVLDVGTIDRVTSFTLRDP